MSSGLVAEATKMVALGHNFSLHLWNETQAKHSF